MALKKVRLELARDHDFPMGSRARGYEFVAPLDADSNLAPEEWRSHRDRCRVRRFWEGEGDEIGHLVRKPGGAWAFHYDIDGNPDDDETGYKFSTHRFVVGEYVSIREQDDVLRTFRVAMVTDLE